MECLTHVSLETKRISRANHASPVTTAPVPTPLSGERERVLTLSHPVTRGDVGERSAPRPRRRKRKPSKEYPPCITGNRSSRQISPRRAREGRSPFELPIKRISAGNRILFRGGAAAGELAPPPLRLIQTSPVPFQTSSVRRSSPPSRACAPPASSSCRIPSPPTRPEPRPRSFP